MFRITEDPSSGSLVQCLAKNYKNDSLLVIFSQALYKLPDDGSSVIRNMLQHFQIFYNFNCVYILYIVH